MSDKPYYADYCRHILRYYIQHKCDNPRFKTPIDKENYRSAHTALNRLSATEREIIEDIYNYATDIKKGIQAATERHSVSEAYAWQTLKRAERLIAKERGLI